MNAHILRIVTNFIVEWSQWPDGDAVPVYICMDITICTVILFFIWYNTQYALLLYVIFSYKLYEINSERGEDSVYMVCRFCTLHVYYTCTCKDWGPCTVVHVHNIIYIMCMHASSSLSTTNKWGSIYVLTFVPIICTHSINGCTLSQALL